VKIRSPDQAYGKDYDTGYLNGYRCGLKDGWAKGFDAGEEWESSEKLEVVQP